MSQKVRGLIITGLAVSIGAFVGLICSIFGMMFLYGVLWMFVFGDNPWPSWTEHILAVGFPIAVTVSCLLGMGIGFKLSRG